MIHFFATRMPYRPTAKTEARRAATRERIVGAAIDQLAEGGYASAGVQAVAARAAVATGTVYRHFPSKSDLFASTVEQGIESGELPPQASQTVAAALVGALGEALVGPLSPGEHGSHEALIASLVQFCLNAIPEPARAEVA